MKTRSGFVSNSSSSSFIIAFDKTPTTDVELLDILFPPDKTGRRLGVSCSCGEHTVDALTASFLILQQIKGKKPLTRKEMLAEIKSGWFHGHPDYPSHTRTSEIMEEYWQRTKKDLFEEGGDPEWRKRYDEAYQAESTEYEKLVAAKAEECLNEKYSAFKNKKCFVVTFSDDGGTNEKALESGNAFRKIPHIYISHH